MNVAIPRVLALLISLTFFVIGAAYVVLPLRMIGSFGLNAPATDSATLSWLRLKGIRDVACGLVIATLWLTAPLRVVGIVLVVLAVVPLGDMSNVLASGGRRSTALGVHGLTCLIVLLTGVWLFHAS